MSFQKQKKIFGIEVKKKKNQVWDVNRQAKVYFLNLIIGQTKCAVLNVQNHLVSRHISDNKNVWISNSLEKVKCKKNYIK